MFNRKKDKNLSVRNANIEKVMAVIDRYLDESRMQGCTCEQCINAVVALALNYLPPHYYADAQREPEVGSPWIMVENAVEEAIEKIREEPDRPYSRKRRQG